MKRLRLNESIFVNDNFKRGRPELLPSVKRKTPCLDNQAMITPRENFQQLLCKRKRSISSESHPSRRKSLETMADTVAESPDRHSPSSEVPVCPDNLNEHVSSHAFSPQ